MTSSGYSGTPLPRKLGIREGSPGRGRVRARRASTRCSARCPPAWSSAPHARGRLDVVVFFVTRRAELARRFPSFVRALEPDGGLWVAWPKKTSGVATDLAFDAVQEVGLDAGLVDNKVCGDRRHLVGPALRVPVADRVGAETARTGRSCVDGSSRCRRRSCSPSASASRRRDRGHGSPTTTSRPGRPVPIVRDRPPRKGAEGPTKRCAHARALGAGAVVGREHRDRRQADQRPGRDDHREGRVQARVRSAGAASCPRTRSTSGAPSKDTSTKRPPRAAVPRAPPRRRADGVRGAVGDLARSRRSPTTTIPTRGCARA